MPKRVVFASFEEASRLAFLNKIASRLDYLAFYREINKKLKEFQLPVLPGNPEKCYREKWSDWTSFCGRKPCQSLYRLREICKENGVLTRNIYEVVYLELNESLPANEKLPCCPERYYKNRESGWPGWKAFIQGGFI